MLITYQYINVTADVVTEMDSVVMRGDGAPMQRRPASLRPPPQCTHATARLIEEPPLHVLACGRGFGCQGT